MGRLSEGNVDTVTDSHLPQIHVPVREDQMLGRAAAELRTVRSRHIRSVPCPDRAPLPGPRGPERLSSLRVQLQGWQLSESKVVVTITCGSGPDAQRRRGKGAQWPSRVDRLLLRHTKPSVAPTPPLNSFRKTGPSGDQGANENLLGMAR